MYGGPRTDEEEKIKVISTIQKFTHPRFQGASSLYEKKLALGPRVKFTT